MTIHTHTHIRRDAFTFGTELFPIAILAKQIALMLGEYIGLEEFIA